MNKIKTLILFLAVSLLVGLGTRAHAEISEAALGDGNFSASLIGVTQRSTATATLQRGVDEPRRIRTSPRGDVKVWPAWWELYLSSHVQQATNANRGVVDYEYNGSTYTIANSTNSLPNPNVFAIANTSEPVRVRIRVDPTNFNGGKLSVYDSRGATDTVVGAKVLYDAFYYSSHSLHSFEFTVTTGVTIVGTKAPFWVDILRTRKPQEHQQR